MKHVSWPIAAPIAALALLASLAVAHAAPCDKPGLRAEAEGSRNLEVSAPANSAHPVTAQASRALQAQGEGGVLKEKTEEYQVAGCR